MPTRGIAPYIHEAIRSLLAQTRQDWTLLISENGAPGGQLEPELSEYLGDPRIRYRSLGVDASMATNHTRLIQDGTAPYVAILHDDDRWDPEFLERRVDFLERHPQCGFVFTGNYEIDSRSHRIRESKLVLREGVYGPQEFVPLLLRRNVIGMASLLVRRLAYQAVGSTFDEGTAYLDYRMWLRISARFPVGYIAARDVGIRVHDSQTTMTAKGRGEMQVDLFRYIDVLVASSPEIAPDTRWLRRRRAGAHLSAALDHLEDERFDKARTHIRTAVRTYPPAVVDPRTPLALVGFAGGRPGRRLVGRLRYLVLRNRLRVHVRS